MKKQTFFGRWMQNSYLLFVFALVISLVVWVYMSFNSPNTETTFTIGDVPIQIELSEEARNQGLQAFTVDDPKATVTVSGNRTVLGLVNENDLSVTASAAAATTTGNFTLPVTANKRTARANFQITASTPSNINVMIDYLKDSEFEILDGITFYLEDGYYGTASLPYSRVIVSGPQTEVQKIKKVVAKANISNKLKKSTEVEAQLVLYDENNSEVSKKLLTLSIETIKATVNVMPEKNVPVEPVFVNKPEGLQLSSDQISVTPSELLLAGPESSLKSIKSVQLDAIDFSKVKNEKVGFDELGINIPENCKNISNYATAKVTLDLSKYKDKSFTVDNFIVEGLSDEYTSDVTSKSISVTLIGEQADLDKIKASQITAVIDTSNASGKTGSVEMPVTFRINGVNSCWAYGSYQANITITKK